MKKFLLLSVLINLAGTGALARPEISIPETVEISQRPLLRLSDIAIVTGGTEELLSFLDGVVLREDSRELVLSDTLNAPEILAKLRTALDADAGLKKSNPSFKIPSQVKVKFSARPISRDEVERRVLNTLKARCASCEYKISVQSTPIPAQKEWDLDLSQLSAKGGFLIPLKDGDQRQLKWVSGTIRVSQLTPVSTRLILQGERVQLEDVRMTMTDVTFSKDGVLRPEDIQGQMAGRSLPVGTPIWSSDLKREPAAKRGQQVRALLGDSSFEISVNMQAEESGFIGDVIKVKNLDNQKILSGVVTEKGVVKLQ